MTFYSVCGEESYNAGVDALLYSCASEPADLSGFCSACPAGQYACCGSLDCSANQPVCTDTQNAICNDARRMLLSEPISKVASAAVGPTAALIAGFAVFVLWALLRRSKVPSLP